MSAYSESPLHRSSSPVPHIRTQGIAPLFYIHRVFCVEVLYRVYSAPNQHQTVQIPNSDTTVSLTLSCMDTGYFCCSFCVLMSVYVRVSTSECVYVCVCVYTPEVILRYHSSGAVHYSVETGSLTGLIDLVKPAGQ